MITIEGKSVFSGVEIGKLYYFSKKKAEILQQIIEDVDAEMARYYQARETAVEQLEGLFTKALNEVGESNSLIFQIHQMMLMDDDYNEAIENLVRNEKNNVEYAVQKTAEDFSAMFAAMDDEYMQARAADVKDISNRILTILSGGDDGGFVMDEPGIVAASDLAPSETIQLDKSKVLGFATQFGSSNSHTAILARTMAIPAVISLGESLTEEMNGHMAIIDGYTGVLYVDPDEETLKTMTAKREESLREKAELEALIGQDNVTKSGRKINVYANIGSIDDANSAMACDAGGVGLFRSEFLYLDSRDFPTEEAQFAAYKAAAQIMDGRKVIIRTLDLGADKQVDYFNLGKEDNPALGYRAIRICLTQPEIFKTQLRALYRAAAYGNIAIMFPMIISVKEIHRIKEIITEVKEELRREGKKFREDVELGVMIETPASVMISRDLAKEVDFFSVGTNDLTQYTLAIDRQNEKLDSFYDSHHPAVLAMIKMAADNAHAEGKWIGICGELGADTTLTQTFVDMGIDELSVSPGMVLRVRRQVRECE
ncbi:MAG: phosphoenolpyruvate--protein phosphotransferase [Lachnospiraceae bacterium]|nr:phosphoenolpyruvate--protein phosphotransferase [Lachnospiraceae bacterium]